MKKDFIIFSVIAIIFLGISANAQVITKIENSEEITELVVKKEIPESICNNKEEVNKTCESASAASDNKSKCEENKQECTKKEKANCTKSEKSKTSGTLKVKKCSANLTSCYKLKAIN